MKPIEFPEQNVVFGKEQDQYLNLPAYRAEGGHVVTCWHLDWKERLRVLFRGHIWLEIRTFDQPIQPVYMGTVHPFLATEDGDE